MGFGTDWTGWGNVWLGLDEGCVDVYGLKGECTRSSRLKLEFVGFEGLKLDCTRFRGLELDGLKRLELIGL